jgi:pyruvate formate-lyase/glycerol dehydratase family glycyl radical enzyme
MADTAAPAHFDTGKFIVQSDHVLKEGTAEYERGQQLRTRVISASPYLCIERARLVTQSYRETEHEHILTRRAKAFDSIMRNMSVYILDDELIVGHQASRQRSAPLYPEFAVEWIRDEIDLFETRPQDRFIVPGEVKREFLDDIYPFWRGRTLSDRVRSYITEEIRLQRFVANVFNISGHEDNGLGHVALDYRKVLGGGLRSIIADIETRLLKLELWRPEDYRKMLFYKSCMSMCESAIAFANRYGMKAWDMAKDEKDAVRKQELLGISEICKRVPEHPARTFHEALQSFWFLQLLPQIYDNGVSISPGRFDQYMYPYYVADIAKGLLTREKAQELLESMWVKLTEPIKIYRAADAAFHAGYPMGQNLCVGGVGPDGIDATTDLSYRCLEAHSHMLLMQPNFTARLHLRTPKEFLLKVCEAIRLGNGMPQITNDEVVVLALTGIGITLPEARDYVPIGCVETAPPNVWGRLNGGYLNLAKIVELALNNGKCRVLGEQVGPKTGDPRQFDSFNQVLEAFKAQMEYTMEHQVTWDNLIDRAHAEFMPTPLTSIMVGDCIEKGRDVTEGGARYNYTAPYGVGIANAGNALYAVKKMVYEDKAVSMDELIDALDTDFKDSEDLRQLLINKVPKYGNDIPEVDLLAKKVADVFLDAMQGYETYRGGPFVGSFIPVASYVALGMATGATPDGRKAGQPLADGISPSNGTDLKGPTAVFKSVCTLDHRRIPNGVIFNQKINPEVIASPEGLQKFSELIHCYVQLGGCHVQFNIVTADTLRQAQKEPEKHRGLVVRVAGYSAFFNEIHRDVQDSIITRTEQEI